MPGSEYYEDRTCDFCGEFYDYDANHTCMKLEKHLSRLEAAGSYRTLIYKALEESGDQPLTLGVKTENGWIRLGKPR